MDYYQFRVEIVVRSKIEQIGNLLGDHFSVGNSSSNLTSLHRDTTLDSSKSSLYFTIYGLSENQVSFRFPRLVVRGYGSRTVLLITGSTKDQNDEIKISDLVCTIDKKMEVLGIEVISIEPPHFRTSKVVDPLEEIPDLKEREIARLFRDEKISYKEIRQKTGVPIGTIGNILCRLRRLYPEEIIPRRRRKSSKM